MSTDLQRGEAPVFLEYPLWSQCHVFISFDVSCRFTRLGGGSSLTSSDLVVDDDDELPELLDLEGYTPVACSRHKCQRLVKAKL
ncbi:hypothetical protein B0H16DRAFT_1716741 [Mycena metata]|uniref:Uncharacterized protein n=1 Tax=Mycena metata TaxID=1033252 RepID=A0AAD7JM92_9AGAR|nr:hypothetical protein B0H16DRAFT_1716741 [Mycena metata]